MRNERVDLFINAAGDKPMYEQVKDGIKDGNCGEY
jgi:hypothetical protein